MLLQKSSLAERYAAKRNRTYHGIFTENLNDTLVLQIRMKKSIVYSAIQ